MDGTFSFSDESSKGHSGWSKKDLFLFSLGMGGLLLLLGDYSTPAL